MRRQYFYWAYLVFAVVLTMYGTYSIIYSLNHQKDIPLLAIIFVTIGVAMLVLFAVLFLISVVQKKKRRATNQSYEEDEEEPEIIEEKQEESQAEETEESEVVEIEQPAPKNYSKSSDEVEYVRTKSSQ